jgi:hypothetical protein
VTECRQTPSRCLEPAGVTVALAHFVSEGVVKTARGVIAVKDREGLLGCATGLYGAPEAELERLFGG